MAYREITQARRLGLLVPGMPGYLTERARLAAGLRGEKKPSKDVPLMWDVASKESYENSGSLASTEEKLGATAVDFAEMVSHGARGETDIPQKLISRVPLVCSGCGSAASRTTTRTNPSFHTQVLSQLHGIPSTETASERGNRYKTVGGRIGASSVKSRTARGDTWQAQGKNSMSLANRSSRRLLTESYLQRGKSIVDQYPQEHVPPLRLSIERARPRKNSRAAELADQLGNKIFGHPRLPVLDTRRDVDLEAQNRMGTRPRAHTGVEMTQTRGAAGPPSEATPSVEGRDAGRPGLRRVKTSSIPPTIQLMTFVRMPIDEPSRALVGRRTWHLETEEEQEKAIQSEWAGVVLGVTEMEVIGKEDAGNDVWGGSV